MSGSQIAHNPERPKLEKGVNPDMLQAKLWANPCPFAFRINYLALL